MDNRLPQPPWEPVFECCLRAIKVRELQVATQSSVLTLQLASTVIAREGSVGDQKSSVLLINIMTKASFSLIPPTTKLCVE